MKRLFFVSVFLLLAIVASAEEIALYNANSEPTAYIDASQSDLPIFRKRADTSREVSAPFVSSDMKKDDCKTKKPSFRKTSS